ncbi:MAG: phosphatase PAP2 family protein [Acidaminococcaceae bacterium]
MFKHRGLLIIFLCLIVASILGFLILNTNSPKAQNLFTYKDIVISQEQNIKTLMAAGGNVVVDSKIKGHIFVVDGDLTISANSKVAGQIVVLGGNVTVAPQAELRYRPFVFLLHGHPFVPLVVASLLGLGALSLIAIPLLLWLVGYYFKKSPFYQPAKNKLLELQKRWSSLYIALGFILSAGMLYAFLGVAWNTFFKTSTVLFDDAFIWLVRYYANPALDKFMLFITDIGFGKGYAIIVGATIAVLAYKKRWQDVSALGICIAGAGLLSILLKISFQRMRPDSFFLVQETSFSFPSGHATATMCFYGMLAFFLMREVKSWPVRLLIATLTIILSLIIGISRIYLGVHYPTDVVAGYAIGFMWLTFCISLLLRQEKKNQNNS